MKNHLTVLLDEIVLNEDYSFERMPEKKAFQMPRDLVEACMESNMYKVLNIVKKNKELVNSQFVLNGFTTLHFAINLNNHLIVEQMLSQDIYKPNLKLKTLQGYNILHLACILRRNKSIKIILNYNPELVTVFDFDFNTCSQLYESSEFNKDFDQSIYLLLKATEDIYEDKAFESNGGYMLKIKNSSLMESTCFADSFKAVSQVLDREMPNYHPDISVSASNSSHISTNSKSNNNSTYKSYTSLVDESIGTATVEKNEKIPKPTIKYSRVPTSSAIRYIEIKERLGARSSNGDTSNQLASTVRNRYLEIEEKYRNANKYANKKGKLYLNLNNDGPNSIDRKNPHMLARKNSNTHSLNKTKPKASKIPTYKRITENRLANKYLNEIAENGDKFDTNIADRKKVLKSRNPVPIQQSNNTGDKRRLSHKLMKSLKNFSFNPQYK